VGRLPNDGSSWHEQHPQVDHDKGKDIKEVQRGELDPKNDIVSQDDDAHRGPA